MPIYEFYCRSCHTIYNFLSRRIDTTTLPTCPVCSARLSREVSLFALSRSGERAGGDALEDDGLSLDEPRIEQAMEAMAGDVDRIDNEDPRAAAQLMRKFSSLTGMRFGGSVEEAVARMESGEDPEAIEEDLGEALENEEPFIMDGGDTRGAARRGGAGTGPRRDPALYEM